MTRLARMSMAKVPKITGYFWTVKILTTAVGESLADYIYFSHPDNPLPGLLVEIALFVVTLSLQLRARRFTSPVYWSAVFGVAVFGTTLADFIDYVFLVPLPITSLALVVVLALVMRRWFASEGTLSIHSIDTSRRERYYWLTVFVTFMLGTAVGDLAASTLHLGFLVAGIVFALLFFVPALGYRYLGWNGVVSFWTAYVLTRPFGASFADWAGKSTDEGGLGVGSGHVSIVLLVVIVLLVGFMTITKVEVARSDASRGVG